MSSNRKTHPALTLFRRMFDESAAGDPVVTPHAFVESSIFHARLAREGVDRPENFIRFADWCDEIGVTALAHRLIRAHYRKTGTSGDPSVEAAYRFHRHRAA